MPSPHLPPRGTAAGLSPPLGRAVESGAGESALAVGPGPLSDLGGPYLVSVSIVGTLAALVVTLVVAVAGWLVHRRDGASPSDSTPQASSSPAPADGSAARSPADAPTLSADEEFVVDLLRTHDGRLRQSDIVDASEWSKSKVSRLLSNMERKGYVEKVTIGRENAIVLSFEVE